MKILPCRNSVLCFWEQYVYGVHWLHDCCECMTLPHLVLYVKYNVSLKLYLRPSAVSAIITNSNYLTDTALCSACSTSCRHVQTHDSLRKQSQNCLFLTNETILSTSRSHAFFIRAGQSLWAGWGSPGCPRKEHVYHVPPRPCVITAWALTSSSIGAEFSGFNGCGVGLFWFYKGVIFNLIFCISSVARMAISDEQIQAEGQGILCLECSHGRC